MSVRYRALAAVGHESWTSVRICGALSKRCASWRTGLHRMRSPFGHTRFRNGGHMAEACQAVNYRREVLPDRAVRLRGTATQAYHGVAMLASLQAALYVRVRACGCHILWATQCPVNICVYWLPAPCYPSPHITPPGVGGLGHCGWLLTDPASHDAGARREGYPLEGCYFPWRL